MKIAHLVALGVLSSGLLLGVGCGKKAGTETPQPETGSVQKQADSAAAAAKDSAQQAMQAAQQAAKQAAQAAKEEAQKVKDAAVKEAEKLKETTAQAVSGGSEQAQEIIDRAKKLVAEKKWQDLAETLPRLKDLKLTPEQEKSLRELKEQLEKMVKEALGSK
jgi:hypothetical protein